MRSLVNSFKFFRGNLLTVNRIVADKEKKLNLVKNLNQSQLLIWKLFILKKNLLKLEFQ